MVYYSSQLAARFTFFANNLTSTLKSSSSLKMLGSFMLLQVFSSGLVFAMEEKQEFQQFQDLYIQHRQLHQQLERKNQTGTSVEIDQLHQQLHEQQKSNKEADKLTTIGRFHLELHEQQRKNDINSQSTYH
ncbi:hypothetical protein [Candidatus Odyssella acanthamoebae]|uniref:Uncharacterized protein n=1 Tax=Candidatus Odyssella acanthamoebae TaxID=91604 RepID=A0A077AW66_9PROT|nr:hypothetical protein [Candidatus Paracaedibacter acanthamoebae]AIK96294.1 hypothetical protein ID47_05395 [Candidatus Paracaedibacter acanthamoebae]